MLSQIQTRHKDTDTALKNAEMYLILHFFCFYNGPVDSFNHEGKVLLW